MLGADHRHAAVVAGGAPLARYDFLFLAALAIQLAMLGFKLETLAEAKVILIFHVVGTAMEIFKTSAGSWIYPGGELLPHRRRAAVFRLHVCGGRLVPRPHPAHLRHALHRPIRRYAATVVLCVAIYVELLRPSFHVDLRYLLFAAIAALYFRTVVHYRVFRFRHRMPLLLGFLLVALFIWFAENIGTWSRAWIYPGQADGMDAGVDRQARRLVSADDHLVRAGVAGAPATAAGRRRAAPVSGTRDERRSGSAAEADDRKLEVDLAGLFELERDRHCRRLP